MPYCSKCTCKITDDCDYCPNCGSLIVKQVTQVSKKNAIVSFVLGLNALAFLMSFIIADLPYLYSNGNLEFHILLLLVILLPGILILGFLSITIEKNYIKQGGVPNGFSKVGKISGNVSLILALIYIIIGFLII